MSSASTGNGQKRVVVAMRRQRPQRVRGSSATSPAARHPTSGTTRETHRAWPRTPLATGPSRSGTHAACRAPRRHTMPSAQATGKREGGAGRTSVSQSVAPTGHSIRRTFAEGSRERGQYRRFSRKVARPAGFEPATPGLEGRPSDRCARPETGNNRELRHFSAHVGHFSPDNLRWCTGLAAISLFQKNREFCNTGTGNRSGQNREWRYSIREIHRRRMMRVRGVLRVRLGRPGFVCLSRPQAPFENLRHRSLAFPLALLIPRPCWGAPSTNTHAVSPTGFVLPRVSSIAPATRCLIASS